MTEKMSVETEAVSEEKNLGDHPAQGSPEHKKLYENPETGGIMDENEYKEYKEKRNQ